MTNEEVIRYAKDVSFCSGCPVDFSVLDSDEAHSRCSKCEHRDFFETVVRMAEKQIPKKPWLEADDDTCVYYHYQCPTCGERFGWKIHHCKCGQAIDWSKENGND